MRARVFLDEYPVVVQFQRYGEGMAVHGNDGLYGINQPSVAPPRRVMPVLFQLVDVPGADIVRQGLQHLRRAWEVHQLVGHIRKRPLN